MWPPQFKLPEIIASPLRTIVARIVEITLVDSPTIRISRDKFGTSAHLFGRTSSGGIIEVNDSPIVLKQIEGAWKAGIHPDYFLQLPIEAGQTPAELEVDGKLTTMQDDDPAWWETYENDQGWIEGTVTANIADSAYVQSYGLSGSEGGGAIENDGADPAQQSKFRIFLGQVVADGDGLKVKPFAGKRHMLGTVYGDSKDSGGGNAKTITALIGGGM